MEGGFVCDWQVASCSEGSPSAKHVRTHIGVRHFAGSSQKIDMAALNKPLTLSIAELCQESPIPYPRMIIFGILVMVLQGLSTALMS